MSKKDSDYLIGISVLIGVLALSILITYFFVYPIPEKHYEGVVDGILLGGLHGSCAPYNLIISLFDPSRLVFASSYSTLYTVGWIGGLIKILEVTFKFFRVLNKKEENES